MNWKSLVREASRETGINVNFDHLCGLGIYNIPQFKVALEKGQFDPYFGRDSPLITNLKRKLKNMPFSFEGKELEPHTPRRIRAAVALDDNGNVAGNAVALDGNIYAPPNQDWPSEAWTPRRNVRHSSFVQRTLGRTQPVKKTKLSKQKKCSCKKCKKKTTQKKRRSRKSRKSQRKMRQSRSHRKSRK